MSTTFLIPVAVTFKDSEFAPPADPRWEATVALADLLRLATSSANDSQRREVGVTDIAVDAYLDNPDDPGYGLTAEHYIDVPTLQ